MIDKQKARRPAALCDAEAFPGGPGSLVLRDPAQGPCQGLHKILLSERAGGVGPEQAAAWGDASAVFLACSSAKRCWSRWALVRESSSGGSGSAGPQGAGAELAAGSAPLLFDRGAHLTVRAARTAPLTASKLRPQHRCPDLRPPRHKRAPL